MNQPAQPKGTTSATQWFFGTLVAAVVVTWSHVGWLSILLGLALGAVAGVLADKRNQRHPEWDAYIASLSQYQQQAQYQQAGAVPGVDRADLQMQAMHDWIRLTGQQERPPTWEWVVNRMADIERERQVVQQPQVVVQQQQGWNTLGLMTLWQQQRTINAINHMPANQQAWDFHHQNLVPGIWMGSNN